MDKRRKRRAAAGNGRRPSVSIVLPSVDVYAIDHFHVRRGLIGSQASRSWWYFDTTTGVRVGVDTTHEGSGANCVTWNATLAGAQRVNVALSDGAKTAAEWATATAAALVAAGYSAFANEDEDGQVRVVGANAIGWPGAYSETLRGVQGVRRTRFATSGSPSYTPVAPSYTAVNATASVHVPAPATAGRIIAVGILDTSGARSGTIRVGVSGGPTYSVASKALTGGVEGIATAGSNDLYLLKLTAAQIQAFTSSEDKWVTYRSNTAAAFSVAGRNHGSSPVGNGDLVVNERVLFNTAVVDPATAIFDGSGNYTQTAAGNATSYAAVFYVFEQPSGGDYYGDASIDTIIGYRTGIGAGTPQNLPTAVVGTSSDTPRYRIAWSRCSLESLSFAAGNNATDEDFGGGVYDMSAVTTSAYPFTEDAPQLHEIVPVGASSGSGYKTYTFDPPVDLDGVDLVGIFGNGGNDDGVTATDTITVLYDRRGNNEWGDGWIDQREWNDSSDVGGLGGNTQYVTLSTGDMPVGDPSPATSPDPFDTDATDTTAQNIPRHQIHVTREGFRAAA